MASEYDWARQVLVKGFEKRIAEYLTPARISRKITEKHRFSDVLYESMLRSGAGRDHYVSMLTYWSIGQGIAVSMRTWIEELIKELVLHPNNQPHFGHPIAEVFTLKDLKRLSYATDADIVATAGESETEHTQNRSWEVKMRSSVVAGADLLSECILRAYERRKRNGFRYAHDVPSNPHGSPDAIDMILDTCDVGSLEFQRKRLFERAVDVKPSSYEKQRIICNLIVLEQPPGSIRAFRFASPGLSSLRQLKDEKRNLLLVYG